MKHVLFGVALILGMNVSALADQEPTIDQEIAAVQGALDGAREFIRAAEQKDFASITHQQMDTAVRALAEELISRNDSVMANELLQNWEQTQFAIFMSFHDLGDHAPLLPWLEDFLQQMAGKYGNIILTLPIVTDIRTLNFAIPVVFAPKGTWQVVGADNRIEYRKHFIPFANIVTYYSAKAGCNYIVTKNGMGDLKKLCGKVAEKLKFVMGRYIAPVISDYIFNSLNNLTLTDEQLVYTNPEQLLQEVK